MRGEHLLNRSGKYDGKGSSPHARGALQARCPGRTLDGIIPACAGSTAVLENRVDYVVGSSPHARGARLLLHRVNMGMGIIPACAGSTEAGPSMAETWRDHPRMRGEHASTDASCAAYWGSSPHARGARRYLMQKLFCRGIIPACAGSTVQKQSVDRLSGDHPRMRGEHWESSVTAVPNWGSSPHARGAPSIKGLTLQTVGIIPACAGSTR